MSLCNAGTDRLLSALGVEPTARYIVTIRQGCWSCTTVVRAHSAEQAVRIATAGRDRSAITTSVRPDAPLAILGPGGDFTREVRP